VSSAGSFFSYINDARSHEPEVLLLHFLHQLLRLPAFVVINILFFFSFSSATVCYGGPWLSEESSSIPDGLWPLPAFFLSPTTFMCFSTPVSPSFTCLPVFLVPSIVIVSIGSVYR